MSVALILGSVAHGACTANERQIIGFGACCVRAIVGGAAKTLRQRAIDSDACGACDPGHVCNRLERPARCLRAPGERGTACGTLDGEAFDCAAGLECLAPQGTARRVCTPVPQEGDGCEGDGFARCAQGLYCFGDGRCRRACPPCEGASECNVLETPPRCTQGTAGTRCGPVETAARFLPRSIRCNSGLACIDRGGGGRCEAPQGAPKASRAP